MQSPTKLIWCIALFACIGEQQQIDAQRVCNLPAQAGNCFAYIPSFYYEKGIGRCQEFVYGGCGGNENRFETLRECQRVQRLCLRGRRPPPLPIPFDPHK